MAPPHGILTRNMVVPPTIVNTSAWHFRTVIFQNRHSTSYIKISNADNTTTMKPTQQTNKTPTPQTAMEPPPPTTSTWWFPIYRN